MHSFGKRLDRRALGFKTCAMGRLASVNSSMISELSSNKQNLPLITERGAASFPFGPVRSVVARTICTGRPLCSVAWITFSRFREEFSMWLQITKWSGRSDYWHKWLNSVNVALCLWGICPSVSTHWAFREEMRSVPSTWCQSSTSAEPANFGMSCLTWIRDVWSADHKTRMQLRWSKIPRMKTKRFSNCRKSGSPGKGNALCHWGPEKRHGSTADDDDAAAGSLGSSSIVITRGRLEEEDDVPDSALGLADDEAAETALGLAPTDADVDTTWPPLP